MGAMNVFKVHPQGKRLVAKAGQWGLSESVFMLERTDQASGNLMHVTYQQLLPPESDDEYIELDDAHERTGISESELITLCTKGVLKAKKTGERWSIQLRSLKEYIG
jgi:hypothetical protein